MRINTIIKEKANISCVAKHTKLFQPSKIRNRLSEYSNNLMLVGVSRISSLVKHEEGLIQTPHPLILSISILLIIALIKALL